MKSNEKSAIIEALKKYIARYPSQARAAESLKGVSAATLSQMLNGKHDSISEEMWRSVSAQVSPAVTISGLNVAETSVYQEISMALADAQEYCNVRWIVSGAGSGKTTTATIYAAEHREVFVVLCYRSMTQGDFLREIARVIGLRTRNLRINDILNSIVEKLSTMESPLLIFDEGDKLEDNVLNHFITLYNRLEGKCGIAFLSTEYIKTRISRGYRIKRGYEEIFSRIGRKYFDVEPLTGVDVIAICHANGLDDRHAVASVVEKIQDVDFDLRCIRNAIRYEKRLLAQKG